MQLRRPFFASLALAAVTAITACGNEEAVRSRAQAGLPYNPTPPAFVRDVGIPFNPTPGIGVSSIQSKPN
jgi:hypothetical protein